MGFDIGATAGDLEWSWQNGIGFARCAIEGARAHLHRPPMYYRPLVIPSSAPGRLRAHCLEVFGPLTKRLSSPS